MRSRSIDRSAPSKAKFARTRRMAGEASKSRAWIRHRVARKSLRSRIFPLALPPWRPKSPLPKIPQLAYYHVTRSSSQICARATLVAALPIPSVSLEVPTRRVSSRSSLMESSNFSQRAGIRLATPGGICIVTFSSSGITIKGSYPAEWRAPRRSRRMARRLIGSN